MNGRIIQSSNQLELRRCPIVRQIYIHIASATILREERKKLLWQNNVN